MILKTYEKIRRTKKILVLAEVHEGGEWIATERLLSAVHKFSKGSLQFSLIAFTQVKKPRLDFVKYKVFLSYSKAVKPFSFIKKLIDDVSKARNEISMT